MYLGLMLLEGYTGSLEICVLTTYLSNGRFLFLTLLEIE